MPPKKQPPQKDVTTTVGDIKKIVRKKLNTSGLNRDQKKAGETKKEGKSQKTLDESVVKKEGRKKKEEENDQKDGEECVQEKVLKEEVVEKRKGEGKDKDKRKI